MTEIERRIIVIVAVNLFSTDMEARKTRLSCYKTLVHPPALNITIVLMKNRTEYRQSRWQHRFKSPKL